MLNGSGSGACITQTDDLPFAFALKQTKLPKISTILGAINLFNSALARHIFRIVLCVYGCMMMSRHHKDGEGLLITPKYWTKKKENIFSWRFARCTPCPEWNWKTAFINTTMGGRAVNGDVPNVCNISNWCPTHTQTHSHGRAHIPVTHNSPAPAPNGH